MLTLPSLLTLEGVGEKMMRTACCGVATIMAWLLASATPCAAASKPVPPASPLVTSTGKSNVQFTLAESELAPNEVEVFHGVQPDKGDWSSILVGARRSDSNDKCTAVFVGRNALLTAAHCLFAGHGRTPDAIVLQSASWTMSFACSVDEVYMRADDNGTNPRTPADYALCAIDPLAPRPMLLRHNAVESIDLTPTSIGEAILLAGYGCVSWTMSPGGDLVRGPARSVLAVGDAVVASEDAETFSSHSDAATAPALCSGDSGGPVFVGPSSTNLAAPRVIRGVASRLDPDGAGVSSTFAALSTQRFRRFVGCWMGANPDSGLQLKQAPGEAPVLPQKC